MKTEKASSIGEDDSPISILRCEIDRHLYMCQTAELHYIIKLIHLEEAKVMDALSAIRSLDLITISR